MASKGELQLPINVEGRLSDPEQFAKIVIKRDNGVITRLGDVARVEIDASQYGLRSLLDNKQAVAIPIFQAPGSNAIQISEQVRATMEELKKNFPQGLDYRIVYDPTVFVRDSIKAVVHTLLEAVLLVVLVVILFLQTWRASIIPLLAVPVSIVGTFAAMLACSAFRSTRCRCSGWCWPSASWSMTPSWWWRMSSAISRPGLTPRDATLKAMREVTGPIIAIALVLCAVFVPIAFISGLTGEFYRQFALTIAFSTIISAFNSLTLSPALAALLLQGHDAPKDALTRGMDKVLGRFFARFNRLFHRGSRELRQGRRRHSGPQIACRAGLWRAAGARPWSASSWCRRASCRMQDKQYLVSFAQLPEGATLDRTEAVIRKMSDIAAEGAGRRPCRRVPRPVDQRLHQQPVGGHRLCHPEAVRRAQSANLSGIAIAQKLQAKFAGIKDAIIAIFPPPPVQGLGTIGGFKLQVEDRTDQGDAALNQVMATGPDEGGARTPELAGVFSSFNIGVPQLYADLDRTKAMQLGVDVQDVFDTMQIYLGSLYVNDFNRFGRTYQVIAQADTPVPLAARRYPAAADAQRRRARWCRSARSST